MTESVLETTKESTGSKKPGFVLIHGAWHGARTWDRFSPLLEAQGHRVRAVDLPGAGANARTPLSYSRKPFDPVAFASEPSPNAHVTQAERTEAVIDVVQEMYRESGTPVVLLGHSLGGVTVTAVAEAVPEMLAAAVYLSGLMIPPGMSVGDMIQLDVIQNDSLMNSLVKADPAVVGAMRLDTGSDDPAYREQMRLAFCADISAAEFAQEVKHLHSDETIQAMVAPSGMTAARFGSVERHYIRALQDRALPIAAQDHMIAEVDRALGSRTLVHTLDSSHAPYVSQPRVLAALLSSIAAESVSDSFARTLRA